MLTLQQFVDKYKNKHVDIDKSYGPQCKDLFSAYNTEVVGNPNYVYGDAWQLFDNTPDKYYQKIINDGSSKPRPGDVIVWKKSFGGFGHVAICISSSGDSFTSFDQNFPVLTKLDSKGRVTSKGSPPHLVTHDYGSVMGWLRPKNSVIIEDMELHDFIVDGMPADERINALKDQVKRYKDEIDKRDDIINSPTDGINALKEKVEDRDKLLDEKRGEINILKNDLDNCKSNNINQAEVEERLKQKVTTKILNWLFKE